MTVVIASRWARCRIPALKGQNMWVFARICGSMRAVCGVRVGFSESWQGKRMIGRLRCPDVFEPTRAGTGGQRSLRPLSPRSRFRDRLLSGSWHAKTRAIQHEIGFPPKISPTDSGEEAIFGEGSNSVTVGVAITGIDSDSFVTEGSAGPIRHSARQTTMNTGRNRAMVGLVTAHPLRSRCRRFCNATHKSGTTTASLRHAACI
jgi:hypothetical protein